MDCLRAIDIIMESERDDPLPFVMQIRFDLHLLFCPACSMELKKLKSMEEILRTEFLPEPPNFSDPIMEQLLEEVDHIERVDDHAGFSFRSWVIIGFFLIISLSSSYFGLNFTQIASSEGSSFLLPVGITVGLVLTGYGALFIGSHLKELSERFDIH